MKKNKILPVPKVMAVCISCIVIFHTAFGVLAVSASAAVSAEDHFKNVVRADTADVLTDDDPEDSTDHAENEEGILAEDVTADEDAGALSEDGMSEDGLSEDGYVDESAEEPAAAPETEEGDVEDTRETAAGQVPDVPDNAEDDESIKEADPEAEGSEEDFAPQEETGAGGESVSDKESALEEGVIISEEEAETVSENEAEAGLDSSTFDVTDFGAVPDDGKDDRAAFNAALAKAQESSGTITVVIPKGTYDLFDGIYVFSNTNIIADGDAVIKSDKKYASMVYGAHNDSTGSMCRGTFLGDCTDHGFGYTKVNNVSIEGGTWIAAGGSQVQTTNVFAFRHSKNISFSNMTIKNATGHMINLSGTDTATVTNVKFMDAGRSADKTDYWYEAVHLDFCSQEGEITAGAPYDYTPAKNVTVKNCTFENVHAGVGNHHVLPKAERSKNMSVNITVTGCTFKNIDAYAVGERSVDGMTVSNNTAENVAVFAYITDSSNVTISNNTFDRVGKHNYDSIMGDGNKDRAAIEIRTTESFTTVEKITVKGNTIKNAKFAGLKVYGLNVGNCKNITFDGNTILKSGGDGIFVQNVTAPVNIKNNVITTAGNNGIFVQTTSLAKVSSNKVTGTKGNALYVMGTAGVPCTVNASGNTLSSSGGIDLFLSNYAKNCRLSKNVLKKGTFKMAGTASSPDKPKLKSVVLVKTAYKYTGSAIHPPVKSVTDTWGRKLVEGTDYKVGYKSCVTVSDNGAMVRIMGFGTVFAGQEITAKFSITSGEPKKSQTITVKVEKTVIPVGKTEKMGVKGAKTSVSYTSSDSKIATVAANGIITAKKVGTVKIKARAKATAAYEASAVKTVEIKVTPAAVPRLSAVNYEKGIRLSWGKAAGATGYVIYCNSKKIKDIGKGSTLNYLDTAAKVNGKKYIYKVYAKAGTGTSTLFKTVTFWRVQNPEISSLKNTQKSTAVIGWEKIESATGYQVQYGLKKDFSDAKTEETGNLDNKTLTGMEKTKTYYFRVRACRKVNKVTYSSAWSQAATLLISR